MKVTPDRLLPGDAFDKAYVVPGQPPTTAVSRHVVKSLGGDNDPWAVRTIVCTDGPVVLRDGQPIELVAASFLRAPQPLAHHWQPADSGSWKRPDEPDENGSTEAGE